MSVTRSVAKAAGFLMIANLTSRILGFLRETLIAGYFGKTSATDAYNTAFILPDLLYWLLVGGVLSAALIPVFSEYIAKNKEDEGWRVISSIVNIIFLALGAFVILGLIFTPQFVNLIVPGFKPESKILAIHLTRIILIQPLILALSGLTMGILNSYKIFWPSALGTVLYNVCVILFGSLLANSDHPESISGFAVGVVVGAIANFAVQIPALRKVKMRYYPVIDWQDPGVRRIAALALPIIISYTLNQIQVAVNSYLGSTLAPGSITSVWYSYRLYQLPVGIFALSIAVAVFPTLTEHAALNRWESFRSTTSNALRTILFITIPISVGMIVLRFPLIRVLFQHGEFTSKDTIQTALPLFYFCLGITAQAIIQILPRAFYALQDTWTPVTIGIFSMLFNVLWMFILVHPLAQGGLALATSIAAVANMVLLLYLLRRRLGRIDGKRIFATFIQTLGAAILMGAVVWLWNNWLTLKLGEGKMTSLVILVTGTAIGAVIFALTAKLMRMDEFAEAAGLVRRKIRKG